MILRRNQAAGATTPGASVDKVRGSVYAMAVAPARRKVRVHTDGEPCTRCGTRKAHDQKGAMCTPCQLAPRCPVCEGSGRTGRSKNAECYRCAGSGVQPILSPAVRLARRAA